MEIDDRDVNKRHFHDIIGNDDVSELQVDDVPLLCLAAVSGHFWVFECLPPGTDFQRKIFQYSIFGHIARSSHSFERFLRSLVTHFGSQAKVLDLIQVNVSDEIQESQKSDDFVNSMLAIFDKKQPALWRAIGRFSDLNRQTQKRILGHVQSVDQFEKILSDPVSDLMTAAMCIAHSRQLELSMSYLNPNICQASDSLGNTILHHIFLGKSKSNSPIAPFVR
jgi:hypothetical protein